MVRIFTIFSVSYARIMLSCRTGIIRFFLSWTCRCLLQKRRKEMTPVLQARIMHVLSPNHKMVQHLNHNQNFWANFPNFSVRLFSPFLSNPSIPKNTSASSVTSCKTTISVVLHWDKHLLDRYSVRIKVAPNLGDSAFLYHTWFVCRLFILGWCRLARCCWDSCRKRRSGMF